MRQITHVLVLLLSVIAWTCSGADDFVASEPSATNVQVTFRLYMPKRPHEEQHGGRSFSDREDRQILEDFINAHNVSDDPSRTEHVDVILVPFIYADTCQRPLDLEIEAPRLGAFINYYVGGQITFQPDCVARIPIESIEQALSTLCLHFGVTNAVIARGMLWKKKQGTQPSGGTCVPPETLAKEKS